jgi:murein DD-endopeptidase MepM/ murein hydrolase activator NlpD
MLRIFTLIALLITLTGIRSYCQSNTTIKTTDVKSKEVTCKEVTCKSIPDSIHQISFSEFLLPGNNGYIISRFGPRHGRMHYGTDVKMNTGDTVRVVQNGKIIRSNWGTGFGNIIIVEHENNIQTYYGHLSKFIKKKGESVNKGEAIALAGSTGNAKGPHLHFEIHENGKAFDPELVFDFKNNKIRDEAKHESSLAVVHKILKPKGYANNISTPEYYSVRKGDSLWKISYKYKISINTLCLLNHISKNSILQIGQPLRMY